MKIRLNNEAEQIALNSKKEQEFIQQGLESQIKELKECANRLLKKVKLQFEKELPEKQPELKNKDFIIIQEKDGLYATTELPRNTEEQAVEDSGGSDPGEACD